MADRFDLEAVRRYYDRHSAVFVARGQAGSEGALHRAVWGPGVTTRRQAFRHVEDRILELLRALGTARDDLRVVDLGCGVGASLCYLASQLPIRGRGVTLSPVQVQLARERISQAGMADRLEVIEGDYADQQLHLGPADLVYAIESFVHGPSPERFFASCARVVRAGGLLVICDDVKRTTAAPEAASSIDAFRRGWHVNALLTAQEIERLADLAGFDLEQTVDLTPHLELHRPRDRAVRWLLAPFQRVPLHRTRFGYLQGGTALQTCLTRGWIGYDFMQFRRRSSRLSDD
jgi:cyclopropane fatty-acyl-phospholipid synthase-like methyltransferase